MSVLSSPAELCLRISGYPTSELSGVSFINSLLRRVDLRSRTWFRSSEVQSDWFRILRCVITRVSSSTDVLTNLLGIFCFSNTKLTYVLRCSGNMEDSLLFLDSIR